MGGHTRARVQARFHPGVCLRCYLGVLSHSASNAHLFSLLRCILAGQEVNAGIGRPINAQNFGFHSQHFSNSGLFRDSECQLGWTRNSIRFEGRSEAGHREKISTSSRGFPSAYMENYVL